eukprot:scaffold413017_cov32-Prasinocladus_malaysianus.AAC.1
MARKAIFHHQTRIQRRLLSNLLQILRLISDRKIAGWLGCIDLGHEGHQLSTMLLWWCPIVAVGSSFIVDQSSYYAGSLQTGYLSLVVTSLEVCGPGLAAIYLFKSNKCIVHAWLFLVRS